MEQNKTNVRHNERSWAIEVISQVNKIVEENDLAIKRAGGEFTISNGRGSRMFPDVILYGDKELSSILQGWELKMPDVPITDEIFINDAQRKAIALGLNSCVIWNFTYAVFYVLDEKEKEFVIAQRWENSHIKTRQDVALYHDDWGKTLKEVVLTVNDYLVGCDVRHISVADVISQNAINILINENKNIVADHYRNSAKKNAVIGAKIDAWWQEVKIEYTFDETDKFKAYSKLIILNWAYRIIFAHLIKRQQNAAMLIDSLDGDTTPCQADDIFSQITEKCDFYNVFAGLDYDTILPDVTWESLTDLSMFLKENGIRVIDQEMLQNILERCVNTTRRELDGQYTTPKILARILASITVHDWTSDCADPCCGTGTIAHEILEMKKRIGCSIQTAVDTTWASDKYNVPLQIANISMTSGDTINMANRLFQSNALDLHLGKQIDIVDPYDGGKMLYAFPLLGAICSNLPFVPFEKLHADDKKLIENNDSFKNLDKKSDLSYYIALHLSELLKDDGYVGIITSNSWLGTKAGTVFYGELIKNYDIRQVHISGAGRWFQNADVVTTLLVLQKKQKEQRTFTNFYIWKKPLEMIARNPRFERAIINSSLLDENQDKSVMSCVRYSQKEIEALRGLNLSLNALFHDVKWLLEIKHKLTPLRSIFSVFRGSRRGWDKLFFPQKANIEPAFLFPALFNAKNVDSLIAKTDRQAFCCGKKEDELKVSYPQAYKWIKKFEREKNGTGIPLPKVLKRSNMEWYEMKPNEIAHIFTMMNPDNRIFFGKFEKPSFINQRLIGLNFINPKQDYELCHALLNSVLMKFFIEAVGFGRGLGVLDINKENVENCYMLNPDLLLPQEVKKIKERFAVICKKEIVSVEEELTDADWISFNKTVLDAFGLGAYYMRICDSLISLRQVRYAAIEKFPIAEIGFTKAEYSLGEWGTSSLVAEPDEDSYS